jgi:Mg2+-importing ATPase
MAITDETSMNYTSRAFWSKQASELLQKLESTPHGLTTEDAQKRLLRFGENRLKAKKRSDAFSLLLNQFKGPIIIILFFAALLSFFLRDPTDAVIILAIIVITGLLGFWQEKGAANAVEKLLALVQVRTMVIRDGGQREAPLDEVVPGDVVILSAGDAIPGDCLLLEGKNLFVNEAPLTGETYPVEKIPGLLPPETPLAQRSNALFMGTHVVSGSAKALTVLTGKETEFGRVSERLRLRPPETEFERGVRRFGFFLMEVTLILVVAIFAVNVYLARPVLDSLLFSLALAVGLTPQLLPAIISINLSHGASRMAQDQVIVKRLSSIENFGSMDVLCSDKTGTLTEGIVQIHSTLDAYGNSSEKVLFYAYLNAFYETGFANPVDEAIRNRRSFDLAEYRKLDELPYDFVRKRLSILIGKKDRHFIVTKGALQNVLSICSSVEGPVGQILDLAELRVGIQEKYEEFGRDGFRTLGIAYRDLGPGYGMTKDEESDMIFLGFLVLFDPPKSGMMETITKLRDLGVSLKVITGDNQLVASKTSQMIGLVSPKIVTGAQLSHMSDEALLNRVSDITIFAEVEPNQKERIILALKKSGHVVGYMGDGINDASALHAADVGISVDGAVDVAKNAADIVLLRKDLGVLIKGIREGRTTFANTLKYVFMATSANFGNMFSVAGASLFLTFLPLLPKQILLTNLMTDFPEMTIAMDNVDHELVKAPRRWNINSIRRFMITFGLLSSVFDYITFGVLLLVLRASTAQFRTGWFVESVISASLIVLIIRSRRPFFKSRPGKYLFAATLIIVALALVFPFIPLGGLFGFRPLPGSFLVMMGIIVIFYMICAELVKRSFFRRVSF